MAPLTGIRTRLAGAPALLVCAGDPVAAGGRGTVLFYHGFTGGNRPCSSQTAGADETVRPEHARAFHTALKPHYAGSPERLRYVQYPGAGRLFFREVGDRMRRAMAAWFTRWLPEAFGGRRG